MTKVWLTIAALAVLTLAIKAAGPIVLRGRTPSARALAVIAMLAPAVISALVVYQTFGGHPDGLEVDARVVGLVAAGVAIAARLPMIVVIVAAAVATAGMRAVVGA
jgi:uncharacterized membrane protein